MEKKNVTTFFSLESDNLKLERPVNTRPESVRVYAALLLLRKGIDLKSDRGLSLFYFLISKAETDEQRVMERAQKKSMPATDEPLTALSDLFNESDITLSSPSMNSSVGSIGYLSSESLFAVPPNSPCLSNSDYSFGTH